MPTLADVPRRGRHTPRLATPAAGDATLGGAVAAWAKRHMPFAPMRWNRTAWDLLLATSAGRLANREALISVARQNSKTTALEALAGWWLIDGVDVFGGPQTVGWLSHDLKLTERAFVFISRLLEDRVVYRSNSFGRQRLVLDNGSELAVQSNSAGAGHGWSFDLCVVDEAWRVKAEAIDHGIRYAQRARPQPLLVLASTAGDLDSTLLRSYRERGLTAIETGRSGAYAFCEWSPPPHADVDNPKTWVWANPCLGTTVTRETLLAEYHGDRNSFLRGALNVWVASAASWLEPGAWERCRDPNPRPLVGGVVACEMSLDGRFVAVQAVNRSGVVHVAPLAVTTDVADLWAAVEDQYPKLDRLAVAVTLDHQLPVGLARKRTVVGVRELARQMPWVRSLIAHGQIAHPGSGLLDEHVARAVPSATVGLSTHHSNGAIELARCLVWAAALASRPNAARRPAVATATATPERKPVRSAR